MPRTLSISTTLLALAGACAAAEDASTTPTPTIIVTAERGESDRERSPFVTEIVTASDIADRGYVTNGADWLRGLAGVTVINRYGGIDGGTTDIRVRGIDPVFTQVQIDGIPLNDPSSIGGDLNPSLINPAGVDRVEVLKGAQSGLYGSRAIGGVINVISARPTAEAHESVRATAGSFRTVGLEVAATGPIGSSAGYAVGVSGLSSRGFSTQTDQAPGTDGDPKGYEQDGVQRLSVSARFEARPADGTQVYAAVFGQRANQEYDELSPDDALPEFTARTRRILAGGQQRLGSATISADIAFTSIERVNDTHYGPPPAFSADTVTYRGSELFAQSRIEIHPVEQVRLATGADVRSEHADQYYDAGDGSWSDQARTVGAYVQAGWDSERASISLVGRGDRHSDFGTVGTGRAALALWPVERTVKVRASVANGFRSPSLYQLNGFTDFGFGYGFTGNPDLEPERAVAYEAGADWYASPGIEFGATAFRTDYREKIVYDSSAAIGTYRNLHSDAQVDGIEFAARGWCLGGKGVDLEAHLTVMRSEDGEGHDLAYVPEASGGGRATFRQQAGGLGLWQSVGVERSTGFATGSSGQNVVPGYTLVDAALGVTIARNWEASVRIENLFDEHYLLTSSFGSDYSTAPRMWFVNLAARF